jgi:peptide/nickel transport system permease protein
MSGRYALKGGEAASNLSGDAGAIVAMRPRPRYWSTLRKHKGILAGGIILAILVAAALLAPLIVTNDPRLISAYTHLRAPNAYYFFGTDSQGRDVYSRVIYGARLSLFVGCFTSVTTLIFGTLIGMVTSYYRRADAIIMRVIDGMMAFPGIILAIGIMAVRGPSVANVIVALTIVGTPRVVRLVRSLVLGLREIPFVEAAVASGNPDVRIMWRHILPNILAPLIVQASITFADAILAEATLSFLGAGAPPEIPSWGSMLADSKNLLQQAPWTMFFPGAALALAIFGLNLLGDGLRDLLDPRLRER